MKRIFLIFLFFLLSVHVFSQVNEVQKLSTLCKVWGFLKYYHPVVTKGKIDWDKELVEKIAQIKSCNNKAEVNEIYLAWINSLGMVKKCHRNNNIPDSLKYNLDLDWMCDTTVFSKDVIDLLDFIRKNRSKTQGYYICGPNNAAPDFSNEKKYSEMGFPSESYRLLGLFRYWNIIQYFFPYKYEIREDWKMVLDDMVPEFITASDSIEYNKAIALVTARVNDTHAWYYSEYINYFFGDKSPFFKIYILHDSRVVVSEILNDSLAMAKDVQVGDIIVKIDGRNIKDLINEKGKYIGASNTVTKMRNLKYFLCNSSKDTVNFVFERDGVLFAKLITMNPIKSNFFKLGKKMPACRELADNVGYIDMEELKGNQLDSVMQIMMNKKAIIFDVRNYPEFILYKIARYLNDTQKPFASFTKPDFSYPGVFKWDNFAHCGKKNNEENFKGKVVILFNENTQSRAEFTCMALQTAPDVISIGSQTAGADGNVTRIVFPGNYTVYMTGLGVYYPNGRETQRIGLVPDIEVVPTIEGIKSGRDEALERAIEYIKTGK